MSSQSLAWVPLRAAQGQGLFRWEQPLLQVLQLGVQVLLSC